MPTTISNKFAYADDLALATQGTDPTGISNTLLKDFYVMATYFSYWCLRLNPVKTTVTAFHLNNHMADACLNVTALGIPVRNEDHPVYLGVTLDRSLTYRQHITKLANKAKSRVNIITKLAVTNWGSKATLIRTASLALVYSASEYCSPTWSQSSHVKKIDMILNKTMRTITETLQPTPLPWLPVLSNITPPSICRQNCALRQWLQCVNNQDLPIHKDLSDIPKTCLKSCKPIWIVGKTLQEENFDVNSTWHKTWESATILNKYLVEDPCEELPGFQLHMRKRTALNRIWTSFART